MKSHQITIYDIARHLNISKSTVSRALTGHPNISAETRRAVMEFAEKMDYQRNVLSVSLTKNKTNTIGILVPEFKSSFFAKIVAAAQHEASCLGYNVVVCISNENYETEVANSKTLMSYQVDGLLVSLSKETCNYDHLKKFQRKGIPLVFFNNVCDEMLVPKVVVNDYDASFAAVEHLIQSGRRRIAHMAGPDALATSRKRYNGYADALKSNGLQASADLVIPFGKTTHHLKGSLGKLIKPDIAADAIFAADDMMAIDAIKNLKAMDINVPHDISVAGFGDDNLAMLIEPGLTTLSLPAHQMGQTAMQILIGMINKDASQWRAVTRSLEADLVIRESSSVQRNVFRMDERPYGKVAGGYM